jgi:hypothetical protein
MKLRISEKWDNGAPMYICPKWKLKSDTVIIIALIVDTLIGLIAYNDDIKAITTHT